MTPAEERARRALGKSGWDWTAFEARTVDALTDAIVAAIADEREACANIAAHLGDVTIVAAILARGKGTT